MRTEIKLAILDYLKKHDDGSDDAKELIKKMEYESNYADCDAFSVSEDDLANLSESATRKLENVFEKSVDEFGIDEYQRIADAMADMIADEYSENLYNAIEYEL